MKTANTTAAATTAIVPVVADNASWSFAPTAVSLNGRTFEAAYSVTPKGDVYAFAKVDGVAVRIHVAKGSCIYDAALQAAVTKPAEPAAPAKQESKPAAKAAKQPAAKPEAKPVVAVGDKSWIGTTLTGKGFTITFDADAQRTRLAMDHEPSAREKALIADAGFFWAPSMGTYNKGLRCKAYRAAQELAAALNALA